MPTVELRVLRAGVDVTDELEYETEAEHTCGYRRERVRWQGQAIGFRESGMLHLELPADGAEWTVQRVTR